MTERNSILAAGALVLVAVLITWRRDVASIIRLLGWQGAALAAIPVIRGVHEDEAALIGIGAAIALLADVELRRRSGGKESLDTVLGELQQCCLPSKQRWSGIRLFEKLDSFLDEPVFMPLYRQHADAKGFPEMKPVLRDLGVRLGPDVATLNNQQPLSAIRRAID